MPHGFRGDSPMKCLMFAGWMVVCAAAGSVPQLAAQSAPSAPARARGDPADYLYRVAREALNRGDYRRAAQLFNELTQRFPNSSYAYVSGYYEAFSRYRIGTTEELKAADRVLRTLMEGGRSASSANGGH